METKGKWYNYITILKRKKMKISVYSLIKKMQLYIALTLYIIISRTLTLWLGSCFTYCKPSNFKIIFFRCIPPIRCQSWQKWGSLKNWKCQKTSEKCKSKCVHRSLYTPLSVFHTSLLNFLTLTHKYGCFFPLKCSLHRLITS